MSLFIHYILLISFFSSRTVGNVVANTQQQQTNNSSNVINLNSNVINDKIKADHASLNNETKIALSSEGGVIVTEKSQNTQLSAENSLISVDNEFVKTKEKSISARKGVDTMLLNNTDSSNETKYNNTIQYQTANVTKNIEKKKIMTSNLDLAKKNNTASETITKTSEKDTHKPLYLSSEALSKMDEGSQDEKNPSDKIIYRSNKNPTIKVTQLPVHRSPGLIMPIIITILVVPLFAVLGYLALKRGKEAWKNRHYKRMDFLLDGMYND